MTEEISRATSIHTSSCVALQEFMRTRNASGIVLITRNSTLFRDLRRTPRGSRGVIFSSRKDRSSCSYFWSASNGGCAFADSGDRISRGRRFYRVDRRYGIEGAPRTPGAKQQAVRKMDGLLTVPPMEPGERLFYLLLGGPTARNAALISGTLNWVFTCVVVR